MVHFVTCAFWGLGLGCYYEGDQGHRVGCHYRLTMRWLLGDAVIQQIVSLITVISRSTEPDNRGTGNTYRKGVDQVI